MNTNAFCAHVNFSICEMIFCVPEKKEYHHGNLRAALIECGLDVIEKKGLRAEGEYAERDEANGRREAIKRIVNDIVEGAQSQW